MKTHFFKDVQKASIIEIAIGVAAGIMIMNLMAAAFGRVPVVGTLLGFHAEDAENLDEEEALKKKEHMEHLFGRGRARRAGRKKKRAAKRKAKLDAINDKYSDEASQQEDKFAYQSPNEDEGGEEEEQDEAA